MQSLKTLIIRFILTIAFLLILTSCDKDKGTEPEEYPDFKLENPYFGVNLAGADFGEGHLPGVPPTIS